MSDYDNEEYSPKSEIENAAGAVYDINRFKNRINDFSSVKNGASFAKKASDISSAGASASSFASSASAGAATASGATAASTATASAIASTGIGAPVAATIMAVAAAQRAAEITEDNGSGKNIVLKAVLIPLILLIVLVAIILSPAIIILNLLIKPFEAVKTFINDPIGTIQYYVAAEQKDDYFEKYASQLMTLSEDEDLDYAITSQRAMNEETIAVYKNIIDWSIYKAFSSYLSNYLTDLGTYRAFLFDGYSPSRTYEKFLDNPYPYRTRDNSSSSFMTIRDFLKKDFQSIVDYSLNTGKNFNNDLNYAEIFTVICQNSDFNYDSFSYSSFYDLMVSKETAMLLFEMQISDEPTYYEMAEGENIDTISPTGYYRQVSTEELDAYLEETCETLEEDKEFLQQGPYGNTDSSAGISKSIWKYLRSQDNWVNDALDWANEAFNKVMNWGRNWCNHFFFAYDVKVYPYGLEELYQIAHINYNDHNSTFTTMRNYELLDQQENWIRSIGSTIDFGPSYKEERTNTSPAYERISQFINNYNKYSFSSPTGRSPLNYIENSYYNMEVLGTTYLPTWCNRGRVWHPQSFNEGGDTVIIDMYQYINQGDYPTTKRGFWDGTGTDKRKTVKYEGCIDCCYIMSAEYYNQELYNVAQICEKYVNAKTRQFLTGTFCGDYGILSSSNTSYFNAQTIEQQLRLGYPVLFHMKGLWKGADGYVYHKPGGGDNGKDSDHFILIVGFCADGFYVMDPASEEITNRKIIPVNDFRYVNDPFYRIIRPNGNKYIGFK